MANTNNPFGAKIVGSFNSASYELKTNKYVVIASDTTPLYVNDFVKTTGESDANGIPICTKAGANENVRGIVVNFEPILEKDNIVYREAGTLRIAHICDDPYIMLEMQVNGALLTSHIGKYANIIISGGNTATGLSNTQIDLTSVSTTSRQLKIVGIAESEKNTVGLYTKVKCIIHDHELQHGVSGSEENLWKRLNSIDITPFNSGDNVNFGSGGLKDQYALTAIPLSNATDNTLDNYDEKNIIGAFVENLDYTGSTGLLLIGGGGITDAGGGTVNVGSGQGYFRLLDDDTSTLAHGKWIDVTGYVITGIGFKYIGVQYNNGSPIVVFKNTNTWNYNDEFPLGQVYGDGSNLHISNNPWKSINFGSHVNERFSETFPYQRSAKTGGLIIGEKATRYITVSAGKIYDGVNGFSFNALDTSVSATYDGYMGTILYDVGQSQWNNTHYNNGGTPTVMTDGKWGVQWWYLNITPSAPIPLMMVYGTAQYDSKCDAELAAEPVGASELPSVILNQTLLIGRNVYLKNASSGDFKSIYGPRFQSTSGTLCTQYNIIYVSKYGDDNHGGLNPNMPLLTLVAATTKISALSPTISNPAAIVVIGGGDYQESVQMIDNSALIMLEASFSGNMWGGSNTYIKINKWRANTLNSNPNMTFTGAQTGSCSVECGEVFQSGANGGFLNSSTPTNTHSLNVIGNYYDGSAGPILSPLPFSSHISFIGNRMTHTHASDPFTHSGQGDVTVTINDIVDSQASATSAIFNISGSNIYLINCTQIRSINGKVYIGVSVAFTLRTNYFYEAVASALSGTYTHNELRLYDSSVSPVRTLLQAVGTNLLIGSGAQQTIFFNNGLVCQEHANGYNRYPSHPRFVAELTATQSNVTGNGTLFIIPFNNEVEDRTNNYNPGTGTYTAPINSWASFNTLIRLGNIQAAHTTGTIYFLHTIPGVGTVYYFIFSGNIGAMRSSSDGLFYEGTLLNVYMPNTSTMQVGVVGYNGALVIDVDSISYFHGIMTEVN